MKLTSLGLFVTPQNRILTSSNQEPSTEYSSRFQHFNNSMPWLHYYASSPKMLENYFFHGYHKGLGKYHKKFTNSQLAILPFFFDRNDIVRKCVTQVSLKRGMAVSSHNSMYDRWQWENATEGLGKFKGKYHLFYGHASMGLCIQKFPKNAEVENSRRNIYKRAPEVKSNIAVKKLVENMKTHSVSTNCGQVLFLQHPVSKAINEYYKMFPKKTMCGDKFSENRHDYDEDSDVGIHNNGVDFENDNDGIIQWIKLQGNIIFKHLVFNPELCIKDFFLKFAIQKKSLHAKEENTTMNSSDKDFISSNFNNLNESTDSPRKDSNHEEGAKIQFSENICDGNMRLLLENLDMKERKYLVNYITENLPNWFSMVGLYEDLQKSLQMLNVVHRFPMHACIQEPLRYPHSSDNSDKNSDGKVHRNNNSRDVNSFQDLTGPTDRRNSTDQITVPTSSKFQGTESISDRSADFDDNANSSTNTQIVFQNLKEEDHEGDGILKEENSKEIYSEQAESEERDFGHHENGHDINNIAFFSVNSNFDSEQMPFSWIQNRRSLGSKIYFQPQIKLCNRVSEFQKLFHRLNNNEIVQESLALDMEIYKAVKKLYQYQKQMVFNTLKT